ncbi:hypothetical protein Tco_0293594, partial [Tanacetum coccineum]
YGDSISFTLRIRSIRLIMYSSAAFLFSTAAVVESLLRRWKRKIISKDPSLNGQRKVMRIQGSFMGL